MKHAGLEYSSLGVLVDEDLAKENGIFGAFSEEASYKLQIV